jgi:hypothetical protein
MFVLFISIIDIWPEVKNNLAGGEDSVTILKGCVMAQTVSRQPLTTEAQVHVWVSPCGICGGQSGTGAGLLRVRWFLPVSIIPPWLFMLIYHLGDEQYAHLWPQFRDVSLHRHEQRQH